MTFSTKIISGSLLIGVVGGVTSLNYQPNRKGVEESKKITKSVKKDIKNEEVILEYLEKGLDEKDKLICTKLLKSELMGDELGIFEEDCEKLLWTKEIKDRSQKGIWFRSFKEEYIRRALEAFKLYENNGNFYRKDLPDNWISTDNISEKNKLIKFHCKKELLIDEFGVECIRKT